MYATSALKLVLNEVKDLFDLEEIFLHRSKRKIYNDRTFSLEGILYEAPAHLVGRGFALRAQPEG